MKESDILYENGNHWVRRARFGKDGIKQGYQVLENGATAARVVATIGYAGEIGLAKAQAECDRRANKA